MAAKWKVFIPFYLPLTGDAPWSIKNFAMSKLAFCAANVKGVQPSSLELSSIISSKNWRLDLSCYSASMFSSYTTWWRSVSPSNLQFKNVSLDPEPRSFKIWLNYSLFYDWYASKSLLLIFCVPERPLKNEVILFILYL